MLLAHAKRAVLFLSLGASLVTAAQAQWTSTDLHPAGAGTSTASGVGSGIVGGSQDLVLNGAGISGGRALLWTAGVAADLTPSSASASVIYANNGGSQGGQVLIDGKSVAAAWNGNAATFVNLGPAKKSLVSAVLGIYPGVQVGYSSTDPNMNVLHAYIWSGTARSGVDLNPTGSFWTEGSLARGVFGTTVVGGAASPNYIALHACRWNSARNTFKDIHPAGYDGSIAMGIYGSVAVGFAYNVDPVTGAQTGFEAQLWNISFGTSQSIHPAGYIASRAFATAPGAAVGRVTDSSGVNHAFYWNLYTNTTLDLSTVLSPGVYSSSVATGVYVNGNHIEVCGQAVDIASGQPHAILWVYDPPA